MRLEESGCGSRVIRRVERAEPAAKNVNVSQSQSRTVGASCEEMEWGQENHSGVSEAARGGESVGTSIQRGQARRLQLLLRRLRHDDRRGGRQRATDSARRRGCGGASRRSLRGKSPDATSDAGSAIVEAIHCFRLIRQAVSAERNGGVAAGGRSLAALLTLRHS